MLSPMDITNVVKLMRIMLMPLVRMAVNSFSAESLPKTIKRLVSNAIGMEKDNRKGNKYAMNLAIKVILTPWAKRSASLSKFPKKSAKEKMAKDPRKVKKICLPM